jgi:hypothetical protein
MLKFEYEDNGFCRVMFSRSGFLYCWQLDGPDTYKFYRCSQDGEPSHEVMGFAGAPARGLTPVNPGQTQTGRELNTFLAAQ